MVFFDPAPFDQMRRWVKIPKMKKVTDPRWIQTSVGIVKNVEFIDIAKSKWLIKIEKNQSKIIANSYRKFT